MDKLVIELIATRRLADPKDKDKIRPETRGAHSAAKPAIAVGEAV
jgi:hypothetical protein